MIILVRHGVDRDHAVIDQSQTQCQDQEDILESYLGNEEHLVGERHHSHGDEETGGVEAVEVITSHPFQGFLLGEEGCDQANQNQHDHCRQNPFYQSLLRYMNLFYRLIIHQN